MKKTLVVVAIAVLLLIDIIGGIIIFRNNRNPVRDRLDTLDPEKITRCTVKWTEIDDDYNETCYSYTETDSEKIKAMYESIYHMEFKEKKYNPPIGMYFYIISLFQDEQTKVSFSYHPSGLVLKSGEKYMAQITNLAEVDKEYGWWEILDEMMENGVKAREE